jgi:transposase-like protein
MVLSETEEGCHRFIRGLKEPGLSDVRGLSGAELATSDAHAKLRQALEEVFPRLVYESCHTRNSLVYTSDGSRRTTTITVWGDHCLIHVIIWRKSTWSPLKMGR